MHCPADIEKAVQVDDGCDHGSKPFHDLSTEIAHNKDGRLFPGILLYCEGHERPLLRGFFHLIATVFLIFGLWDLFTEANGSLVGEIAAVLYVSSNIWCYGFSALYHVGRWSARVEILFQKLDHCGIAILGCGTMLPVAMLLLPPWQGFLLAFLAVSTCVWACWNILHLRPSLLRLLINGCTLVPFLPTLSTLMDRTEFTATLLVFVFQGLGVLAFTRQRPNPWPGVLGYHEIFHLLVICAGFCVYVVNWSVIRRMCNPEELRYVAEDIIEVILDIRAVLMLDLS